MWEWLGTQAQTASPFVAVFCLFVMAVLARAITKLWDRHLKDQETIATISQASSAASNAVALALERSTLSTTAAIDKLAASLSNNGRRRR